MKQYKESCLDGIKTKEVMHVYWYRNPNHGQRGFFLAPLVGGLIGGFVGGAFGGAISRPYGGFPGPYGGYPGAFGAYPGAYGPFPPSPYGYPYY